MEDNLILHRILNLKVKKVDVFKELNNQGIKCYASQFSDAINGNYPCLTEKYLEILNGTNQILTDWENERKMKNNGIGNTTSN